jgi:hypothetical protein
MRAGSLAFLSVLLIPASGFGGDPTLDVRFRAEAPLAWSALDDFNAKLTGIVDVLAKGEGQAGPGDPDGKGRKQRIRFIRNSNWTLLESRLELYLGGIGPAQIREGVHGMNSRYEFSLSRKTPEEAWTLVNVGPAKPIVEYDFTFFAEFIAVHLRRNPANPEKLADYLFRRRNLQIREVSKFSKEGRELVRVGYVLDTSLPSGRAPNPRLPPDLEKNHIELIEGEMLFDPERMWVLQESKAESTIAKTRELFEYGELKGYPVLRSYEHRSWNQGWDSWGIITADYKDVKMRETPEYEFAVSAYGLPEIDPTIKRPWPIWIWSLVGAGVIGVLAFGTRWYARRRAAA